MSNAAISKIEVKNVFKIFGNRSKEALGMIGQGKPKTRCWLKPAAWSV